MSRDSRNPPRDLRSKLEARGRKRRSEDVPKIDAPKRTRTESGDGRDNTPRPIGFKELENIWKEGFAENAILGLTSKAKKFEALLALEEIRPDLLKLVISAFHRLCSANNLVKENAEKLLRSPISKKFMTGPVLSSFINQMPHSECWKDESERVSVISNLTEIFLALIQRFGESIVHVLPFPQLNTSFDDLKEMNLIDEDARDLLEKKIQQVKDLKIEVIRRAKVAHEQESGPNPPQDFRELSVIPQTEDLCFKPFLRENITDRRFKDLEHYLDVQFRLLREDFVMPLRDGIKQLKKESNSLELETKPGDKGKRANDVSTYHDVTVLYPVCSRKGQVYRIRFNSSHPKVKRVKWEKSKRLIYGALVCLSSDEFNTLVFATVENRNADGLSVGELDVRFENVSKEEINLFINGKEKFVMIESPAYFEAYRHVLGALKQMNNEELPFQKHIVECCPNVGPPEYQVQIDNEKAVSFDFSCILAEKKPPMMFIASPYSTIQANSEVAIEAGASSNTQQNQLAVVPEKNPRMSIREGPNATVNSEVAIADSSSNSQQDQSEVVRSNSSCSVDVAMDNEMIHFNWPDRKSLGFNESQMRAFKLALTKEFAVIQGPPGTGKTYVGLKIARVLLKNRKVWQKDGGKSPILMVSYTNHALDQFLEGLLPMEGIVRVGGRSKSEKLKHCSLVALRQQTSYPDLTVRIGRSAARRDIRQQKHFYSRTSLLLKASRSSIMSVNVLYQQGYVRSRHYDQICRKAGKGSINEQLLKWLDVERKTRSRGSRPEKDQREDDFHAEFATRGFSFDNHGDSDKENNAILMGIAVLSMEDAKNPDYVRRNLIHKEAMSDDEERDVRDVYHLPRRDRWRLYRLWLQRLDTHQRKQLQTCQVEFEEALSRDNEVTMLQEYNVLRKARVIGMTTTCAAKYRHILQKICPKIVLIEEAAEVLEGHIITSLTKGCQHLILIGDHQQLRPTPAVYELAKKYKLDVSLFERMVNVGIERERLSVQHRMRPEIAALMKHIYDDLENDESVEKYEDIKGIKKNMFFVCHSHLENSCEDSHSHVNQHEANFLVALCCYLLQQGYTAKEITILTTYTGQMFAIKECIQAEETEEIGHVRLTTVDNFQGEESEIILLSLVRSNEIEKVGFISEVNRSCVALSRAKKGFYCIGNFALLSKHSDIWSKIVGDLEASDSIGNALPLVCQAHHFEMTAETAEDFSNKAPDGGCQRPCEVRLNCGHACKQLCHPRDPKHKYYLCGELCARPIKGCDHLCSRSCSEPCIKVCSELVEKALPGCGHTALVKCSADLKEVECEERCNRTLPCGHRCQSYCKKPCTTECQELVKRTDWPCGHEVTIACHATYVDCTAPCGGTLECGHDCTGRCGECRMGRIHRGCKKECKRVLVCSHGCVDACNMPCPPCSMQCENRCSHSKCDKKCGKLCLRCRYPCSWECQHHKCYKQCHEMCDRPRCNVPCDRILSCYHACRGLMCEKECICVVCMKKYNGDPITEIFLGGEDDEDARFIRLPDCSHIFAVSDLDRYMDMSEDDTSESHAIQLKACPRCSTPIRLCLRYGNVIKQQLKDIEKVKAKMWRRLGSKSRQGLRKKKAELEQRLTELEKNFGDERQKRSWGTLKLAVEKLLENRKDLRVSLTASELTVALVENKVMLMERFCFTSQKMKLNLKKLPVEVRKEYNLESDQVKTELCYLERRFMSERVTQTELQHINTEFSRLNLLLELCLLNHDIKSLALELDEPSRQVMTAIQKKLSSGKRIEDEKLDEMMKSIREIRHANSALTPLTEEEKKMIVSAMGLAKGRWFKCPKGHFYAIGECGGAMQISTCPECKAVIGGERHQLEPGNELAPEMDGARYAAWSEQANLENYGNLGDIV